MRSASASKDKSPRIPTLRDMMRYINGNDPRNVPRPTLYQNTFRLSPRFPEIMIYV